MKLRVICPFCWKPRMIFCEVVQKPGAVSNCSQSLKISEIILVQRLCLTNWQPWFLWCLVPAFLARPVQPGQSFWNSWPCSCPYHLLSALCLECICVLQPKRTGCPATTTCSLCLTPFCTSLSTSPWEQTSLGGVATPIVEWLWMSPVRTDSQCWCRWWRVDDNRKKARMTC